MSMLTAKQISKTFPGQNGTGVQVIDSIDFTMDKGDSIAILGPSGCGKTTFLNILAGFITPDSGRIIADGQEIASPGSHASVVFQAPTLFDWLSVEENIEFSLKQAGESKTTRREKSSVLISQVELTGFEKAYPAQLSGGMQQRVALARALINQPKILLLDEPFAALDALTRRRMQQLLVVLMESRPISTVFITHDIEEAMLLSKRILIFSARPAGIMADFKVPSELIHGFDMVDSHEFADLKHDIRAVLENNDCSF